MHQLGGIEVPLRLQAELLRAPTLLESYGGDMASHAQLNRKQQRMWILVVNAHLYFNCFGNS